METENWGKIPYPLAHQKQKSYVQEIIKGSRSETVVLCHHPPVVTLGKKSTPDELVGWNGEVYSVERGGRATYHGPGQVVCYPLLNLKERGQRLAQFLDALEVGIAQTLARYGVQASGNARRGDSRWTGVWTDSGKKLASIGVAVSSWVTYHGLALNLHRDPLAFRGINPCGYSAKTMTSLEEILQQKIDRGEFEQRLLHSLIPLFPKEHPHGADPHRTIH